jgi:hypothetical protein
VARRRAQSWQTKHTALLLARSSGRGDPSRGRRPSVGTAGQRRGSASRAPPSALAGSPARPARTLLDVYWCVGLPPAAARERTQEVEGGAARQLRPALEAELSTPTTRTCHAADRRHAGRTEDAVARGQRQTRRRAVRRAGGRPGPRVLPAGASKGGGGALLQARRRQDRRACRNPPWARLPLPLHCQASSGPAGGPRAASKLLRCRQPNRRHFAPLLSRAFAGAAASLLPPPHTAVPTALATLCPPPATTTRTMMTRRWRCGARRPCRRATRHCSSS